jgi:hypothetical protein
MPLLRHTKLDLEIGDLAKRKAIGGNIVKNDKTVLHECAFGCRNERWSVGEALCAAASIESGRPLGRCPSESPLCSPSPDFILYRKRPVRVGFKATADRVCIHFRRNRFVAAAIQESAHVKFREMQDAELPILLPVDELVKQQTARKCLVRDHNIAERDRCHRRLIGQIVEAQSSQHWVEIWVANSLPSQDEKPRAI